MTSVDSVIDRIFEGDFNIHYDDAMLAAEDIVNLIYKSSEYCQFGKVMRDIKNQCGGDVIEGCFN